jgi:type I restriction enzyme M protein
MCILVLKRYRKRDNVVFINAPEYLEKDRQQNRSPHQKTHRIVDTNRQRSKEKRYSRGVEISQNKTCDYTLAFTRTHVVTEAEIALAATQQRLTEIEA